MLDDALRGKLADLAMPAGERIPLVNDKPTFIGHYWLTGPPAPLSNHVVCVDYSAGRGDRLCAYRWNDGEKLSADNFACIQVNR